MINSAAPPSLQGATVPVQAPPPLSGENAPEPVAVRPPSRERPPKPEIQFDPQKLEENLKQAIEHLNKQLSDSGRTLGIRMDEVLNLPVVTVKSTTTGEVIRQIPSEAVIKAAHTFEELKGLLVDETS